MGKFLLALVLLLVVLLVGAFTWANTDSGQASLARRIEEAVQDTAPGFAFRELDGLLPFSIVLREVQVDDRFGTPTLSVARIAADVNLLPLLWKRVEIETLRIASPTLQIQQTRGGKTNLAEVTVPADKQPTREPADWGFVLGELRIHDGTVIRREQQETTLRASQISMKARARDLPDEAARATLEQLSATLEAGGEARRLSATGRGSLGRGSGRNQLDAELQARLAEAGGERTIARARFKASGTLPLILAELSLASETAGSAELSGWVRVPTADGELAYDAALRTHRLDPHGLLASLPQGEIDFRLTLEGRGTPLEAGSRLQGELALQPSSLSDVQLTGAHAQLLAVGESWQLSDLSAGAPGLRLWGKARGTRSNAQLELHATADKPLRTQLPQDTLVEGELHLDGSGPLPFGKNPQSGVPLRVDARLRVERLRHPQLDLRRASFALEGHLHNVFGQDAPGRGQVVLRADPFVINGARIRTLRVSAESDGETLQAGMRFAPQAAGRGRVPTLQAELSVPLAAGTPYALELGGLNAQLNWQDVPLQLASTFVDTPRKLSGRLHAWAKIEGHGEALSGNAQLRLTDARMGEAGPVSARLVLEAQPRALLARLHARVSGQPALRLRAFTSLGTRRLVASDAGDWLAETVRVRMRVPPLALGRISGALQPDEQGSAPLRGQLTAAAELTGSFRQPALTAQAQVAGAQLSQTQLGRLSLHLKGYEHAGDTRAHATLRVAGEPALHVRLTTPATLASAAQGRLPDVLRFELEGQVLDYPLAALARANPGWDALRGELGGELRVQGPLARPTGTVVLTGRDLVIGGEPAGDAYARASLSAETFEARASLLQGDGGAFRARASAEMPGPLHAKLVLDDLSLAFLEPFSKVERPRVNALIQVDGDLRHVPESEEKKRAKARRVLAAELDIDVLQASLPIPLSPSPGPAQEDETEAGWGIDDALQSLMPMRLRRLAVKDAELRLIANAEPQQPTLRLRRLDLTLENLATRHRLLRGAPTVLGARAQFERGELVAFATLDPLADKATFAGQAQLRKLALTSVQEYLESKLGVVATAGEFSAVAAFKAIDGELEGAVKPIVVEPELEAAEDTFVSKAKAVLADVVEVVLPDEIGNRDAEAVVLPIRGTFSQPDPQLLAALFGLIQDSMLMGLAGGAGSAWPWQLPVESDLVQPSAQVPARILRRPERSEAEEPPTHASANQGGT